MILGNEVPDDRDNRRRSQPLGVPIVPTEFRAAEDITGVYKGEELRAKRAKRDTKERVDRLELKHDALDGKVDKIAESTARMEGQLGILVQAHEQREVRETVTYTSTVQIDQAKKVADIEVDKVRETTTIKDVADRKSARRAFVIKAVGIIGAILTSGVIGSKC